MDYIVGLVDFWGFRHRYTRWRCTTPRCRDSQLDVCFVFSLVHLAELDVVA